MKAVYKLSLLFFLINLLSENAIAQTFTLNTILSQSFAYPSVDWGDYDNDGDLDLLITGKPSLSSVNASTKLYKNNGNSTFTDQTSIVISGVYRGQIRWADYNNDGFLDIFLCGEGTNAVYKSKIFKNNGNNTFSEDVASNLASNYYSSLDLGDMDNDGDLDLIIGGDLGLNLYKNENGIFVNVPFIPDTTFNIVKACFVDYDGDGYKDVFITGEKKSFLYKNLGKIKFEKLSTFLIDGTRNGSFAWGDYNGDKKIDLLIGGESYYGGSNPTKIYKNLGNGNFTPLNYQFPYIRLGNIEFGDSDNDGDLDIIITGQNIARLYNNLGNDSFTQNVYFNPAGLSMSTINFGDFDNDLDLDIIYSGIDNLGNLSAKIFTNGCVIINTVPTKPTSLNATNLGLKYKFEWLNSFDSNSIQNNLTYNIRAGRQPSGFDIINPHSLVNNSKRKISKMGNAGLDTTAVFIASQNLHCGDTIFWSVQAIDAAFQASQFSNEDTSIVPLLIKILNNDTVINQTDSFQINLFSNFNGSNNMIQYQWSPVIGVSDATIGNPILTPLTTTKYIVTATSLSGLYATDSITITVEHESFNLVTTIDSAQAITMWGDYDNDGYLDLFSSNGPRLYKNNGDMTFNVQNSIIFDSLTELFDCKFIDLNNDNNLDIMYTGIYLSQIKTKVYINNGNSTFSLLTNSTLPDVKLSSFDFGDYDNDGDMDIFIIGETSSNYISKLFKNTLPTVFGFSEVTDLSFQGVYRGSVNFADFNNDGNLDVLLSGLTTSSPGSQTTFIYENGGNGDYYLKDSSGLPACYRTNINIIDFNSDGLLDIFMSGSTVSPYSNLDYDMEDLYQNDSSFHFTNLNLGTLVPSLNKRAFLSSDWSDFDTDGDLDLITSYNELSRNTFKLFKNNGNGSLSIDTVVNTVFTTSRKNLVSFVDIDNDNRIDYNLGTKIFKNYSLVTNSAPNAPNNLSHTVLSGKNYFSWNKTTDNNTPTNQLKYNIEIRRTNGELVNSVNSNQNSGKLKSNYLGNCGLNNFYTIPIEMIKTGDTIFWKVQSVDNGKLASEFSQTDTIIAKFEVAIIGQDTINQTESCNLSTITNYSGNSNLLTYQWSPSTGLDNNSINNPTAKPLSTTNYSVTVTSPEGWVAIDSFILNVTHFPFVLVKELSKTSGWSESLVNIVDYDNDNDLDVFMVNHRFKNTINFNLVPDTDYTIVPLVTDAFDWGDYDNDGDLDLIQIGSVVPYDYKTKIYKNNIPNSKGFTEQVQFVLEGVKEGDVKWIDYDNDGDLDVFVTGINSNSIRTSNFYKNTQPDSLGFVLQTNIRIPGLNFSNSIFTDFDNDGDQDLLVSGVAYPINGDYIKLFKNTLPDSIGFDSLPSLNFITSYSKSMDIGDYDSDGDIDLLLTGSNSLDLYTNNLPDSLGFSLALSIPNSSSDARWIDYDNDGKLDIISAGLSLNFGVNDIKLYKQNSPNSFIYDSSMVFPPFEFSSIDIGDYDMDNDLDLIFQGNMPINNIYHNLSYMYKNCAETINIPPYQPIIKIAKINNDTLTFCWNSGNNTGVNNKSILYNIMIESNNKIINSNSFDKTTGFMKRAKIQNSITDTIYKFGLGSLNYGDSVTFCVVALDNKFVNSPISNKISLNKCSFSSYQITEIKSCMGDSIHVNGTNYGVDSLINQKYLTTFGCDSIIDYILKFDSLPVIQISTLIPDTIKLLDGVINLPSSLPILGQYFGNGVIGNTFNPSLGEIGINWIKYNYTDSSTSCSNTDSVMIYVLNDVKIKESNDMDLSFIYFPNPTNQNVIFEFENKNLEDGRIQIFDLAGSLLFEDIIQKDQNKYTLNLVNFKTGIYLFTLYFPNTCNKSGKIELIRH